MTDKSDLRQRIDAFCEEGWPDEEILLFGGPEGDPYDEGFIGIGYQQYRGPVAVYDRDRCIAALTRSFADEGGGEDADPHADAEEWFAFNTEGAWVGERTPMVIAGFPPGG